MKVHGKAQEYVTVDAIIDEKVRARLNRAILNKAYHPVSFLLTLYRSVDFAAKIMQTAFALDCIPSVPGGALIHVLMNMEIDGVNTFGCGTDAEDRTLIYKQVILRKYL